MKRRWMRANKRLNLRRLENKFLGRRVRALWSQIDDARHLVSNALPEDLERGRVRAAQIQNMEDEPADVSSDEDMRYVGGQAQGHWAFSGQP